MKNRRSNEVRTPGENEVVITNADGQPIMISDGKLPPAYQATETVRGVRKNRTGGPTARDLLVDMLRRDIRALRLALEARATDSHAFRHDRTVRLRRCPEPSCVDTVALIDKTGAHHAH